MAAEDPSPSSNHWKDLYKAALFETDKEKISKRLALAESALTLRARELYRIRTKDDLQERQAIDSAMYAVRVLRTVARVKAA